MLRLIVMRHAKSSWKEQGQEDHERPLNKRGRRDAPRIAEKLAELGWTPASAFVSDAVRTQETWGLMQGAWGDDVEVDVELRPDLYLAGLQEVKDVFDDHPDATSPALVLGHNPGWEAMASELSGRPLSLTTANAVLLESDADEWTAALAGPWKIAQVLRPRELWPDDADE